MPQREEPEEEGKQKKRKPSPSGRQQPPEPPKPSDAPKNWMEMSGAEQTSWLTEQEMRESRADEPPGWVTEGKKKSNWVSQAGEEAPKLRMDPFAWQRMTPDQRQKFLRDYRASRPTEGMITRHGEEERAEGWVTRAGDTKADEPTPELERKDRRGKVVSTFWRVGKYVIPLAVAGSIGYLVTGRGPGPTKAPIEVKPTPVKKPLSRTPAQHDFPPASVTDKEVMDTYGARMEFHTPKGEVSCAGCHDLKGLAEKQGDEIRKWADEARDVYRPLMPTSKKFIVFHPFMRSASPARRGSARASFSDDTHALTVALPAYAADPRRKDTLIKEFSQYYSGAPDQLNQEVWGWAAPLIKRPEEFREILDPKRPDMHNRFTMGFAARAAFISGKALDIPEPTERPSADASARQEALSKLAGQYTRELEPKDIKFQADLWQKAHEEYSRNDLFWDALSRKFGNDPFIVVDTLKALDAMHAVHPRLVKAFRDRETLAEVQELIDTHISEAAKSKELWEPNPPMQDTREVVTRFLASKHPDIDAVDRGYMYLAAIMGRHLTKQGGIDFTTVPKDQLKRIAEEKIRLLEKTSDSIRVKAAEFERQGDKDLAQGLRERARIWGDRQADLKRAIRDETYLNIHER